MRDSGRGMWAIGVTLWDGLGSRGKEYGLICGLWMDSEDGPRLGPGVTGNDGRHV